MQETLKNKAHFCDRWLDLYEVQVNLTNPELCSHLPSLLLNRANQIKYNHNQPDEYVFEVMTQHLFDVYFQRRQSNKGAGSSDLKCREKEAALNDIAEVRQWLKRFSQLVSVEVNERILAYWGKIMDDWHQWIRSWNRSRQTESTIDLANRSQGQLSNKLITMLLEVIQSPKVCPAELITQLNDKAFCEAHEGVLLLYLNYMEEIVFAYFPNMPQLYQVEILNVINLLISKGGEEAKKAHSWMDYIATNYIKDLRYTHRPWSVGLAYQEGLASSANQYSTRLTELMIQGVNFHREYSGLKSENQFLVLMENLRYLPDDWIRPFKALRHLRQLMVLSIEGCDLHDRQLVGLLTAIKPLPLRYLSVSHNPLLGDMSAWELAKYLRHHDSLEQLAISCSIENPGQLTGDGLLELLTASKNRLGSSLQALYVEGQSIKRWRYWSLEKRLLALLEGSERFGPFNRSPQDTAAVGQLYLSGTALHDSLKKLGHALIKHPRVSWVRSFQSRRNFQLCLAREELGQDLVEAYAKQIKEYFWPDCPKLEEWIFVRVLGYVERIETLEGSDFKEFVAYQLLYVLRCCCDDFLRLNWMGNEQFKQEVMHSLMMHVVNLIGRYGHLNGFSAIKGSAGETVVWLLTFIQTLQEGAQALAVGLKPPEETKEQSYQRVLEGYMAALVSEGHVLGSNKVELRDNSAGGKTLRLLKASLSCLPLVGGFVHLAGELGAPVGNALLSALKIVGSSGDSELDETVRCMGELAEAHHDEAHRSARVLGELRELVGAQDIYGRSIRFKDHVPTHRRGEALVQQLLEISRNQVLRLHRSYQAGRYAQDTLIALVKVLQGVANPWHNHYAYHLTSSMFQTLSRTAFHRIVAPGGEEGTLYEVSSHDLFFKCGLICYTHDKKPLRFHFRQNHSRNGQQGKTHWDWYRQEPEVYGYRWAMKDEVALLMAYLKVAHGNAARLDDYSSLYDETGQAKAKQALDEIHPFDQASFAKIVKSVKPEAVSSLRVYESQGGSVDRETQEAVQAIEKQVTIHVECLQKQIDNILVKIQANRVAINQLNERSDGFDMLHQEHQEKFKGHGAQLEGHESRLDTSESRHKTSESRLDTSESRLDTSESRLDTSESRHKTSESKLEGHENDIQGLKERLVNQGDGEESAVGDSKKTLTELKLQYDGLRRRIEGMQLLHVREVGELTEEIARLKKEKAVLENRVSNLEKQPKNVVVPRSRGANSPNFFRDAAKSADQDHKADTADASAADVADRLTDEEDDVGITNGVN